MVTFNGPMEDPALDILAVRDTPASPRGADHVESFLFGQDPAAGGLAGVPGETTKFRV